MTVFGATGQGINFFRGSFEEALKKAQQENKQIFVDVYTSWCGPCKMMAKEVFTRSDVGSFQYSFCIFTVGCGEGKGKRLF